MPLLSNGNYLDAHEIKGRISTLRNMAAVYERPENFVLPYAQSLADDARAEIASLSAILREAGFEQ